MSQSRVSKKDYDATYLFQLQYMTKPSWKQTGSNLNCTKNSSNYLPPSSSSSSFSEGMSSWEKIVTSSSSSSLSWVLSIWLSGDFRDSLGRKAGFNKLSSPEESSSSASVNEISSSTTLQEFLTRILPTKGLVNSPLASDFLKKSSDESSVSSRACEALGEFNWST